jgi:hypothetical protein
MLNRFLWRVSPGAFASWVVDVLRAEAPEFAARQESPDVVHVGDIQLGLQSLRAIALQGDLSEPELRQTVVERARRLCGGGPELPSTWDEARALLRPQLMPAEYLAQAPAPLLHRPFHSGVVAGVVLDQPDGYTYVRVQDCASWQVADSLIWDEAIGNLNEASRGLKAHSAEGPDRWVVISMQDGYDAARILVPGIRAFLAERLGEPFFAGTPNREFLVAWASDCSPRYWDFVEGKLAKDCREQPYPLTPAVSEVRRDSVQLDRRSR